MSRPYRAYICGPGQPVQNPCPTGGEDHTPWPADYAGASEYADQLLMEGWRPSLCTACETWSIWIPPQPMPQPPNRFVYDDPDFLVRYDEMLRSGRNESSHR